ncbi:MAG: TRAP transporter small permease [Betaproteobacteria bacterium]|nr:TRAP transporter small permease [Betaproteobacteria bacterium]
MACRRAETRRRRQGGARLLSRRVQEGAVSVEAGRPPAAPGGPDVLDRVLGYACAAPLFFIAALTFLDVFARYLFAKPVQGSAEIVQFLMALTIFAALPLVTRHRGHISVSLVEGVLRGGALRAQRVLVDTASLAGCAVIAWQLHLQAGVYAQTGNKTIVVGLPMAPLAWAMCACAAGTCLIIALQIRRALRQ